MLRALRSDLIDPTIAVRRDLRHQSFIDSEVISPTAMAGGNAGLVLCQVGCQYSGQ